MEVKEIMLLKACEGIDMLLSKEQIDNTYIQLLYFIKSLNEDDNLVLGISDKELEELLDKEDTDEPGVLSIGEELFEKLKNLENSMVVSIGDMDLKEIFDELFKELNED